MNADLRSKLNTSMSQLADGDRGAFDFVYETSWPLVNRFAIKTIGISHDAEDIAQHALMKVFSRAQEFDTRRDALSWILGITAFECKTYRQKVRRRKEESISDEVLSGHPNEAPNAEEALIQDSMERAIHESLAELGIQDRETIHMAIFEMERPAIPAATFRKRLQRAMGRLREKWSEKHE